MIGVAPANGPPPWLIKALESDATPLSKATRHPLGGSEMGPASEGPVSATPRYSSSTAALSMNQTPRASRTRKTSAPEASRAR